MVKEKLLVIIPAFNEENSIKKVVDKIKKTCPLADIAVVNDCSNDNTAWVASTLNVILINLPINLGIGGAMQTGYIYANENGYDFAVQVDGDGQHDPAEIPKLLKRIKESNADLIIGSRFVGETGYKGTIFRRIGILFFKVTTAVLNGKAVNDATSGFRLANKRVIKFFSKSYPNDYPEPEVLVSLSKMGFTLVETPVKMFGRESGKSSITALRPVYYMIKVFFAMLIDKLRVNEK